MEQGMDLISDIRTSDLFAGLDDALLERIAALCQERAYEAGAVIVSEGDPADKIYIVQEGIVTVRIQPAASVKSIVVEPIEKTNGVFGWSALTEPFVYTASAVCATDARVIGIDGKKLMALLEENPLAGFIVMKKLAVIISSRLRRTWDHLREDVYLASYRF
jgi:CRP/FNR family cyclic AMP-dependent transcriptional regulator